ncbi:MAG: hypothetical protein LUG52_07895 [Clostridia bacterium]|nr:hypothetical protein [Clostridia bacterium]
MRDYYKNLTNDELRESAEESSKKAKRKGAALEPIVVEGRKITKNWWGNAWCANLEKYADYENRIDRGKRYVRSGAVIDLKIEEGKVLAKVQGSRRTPYKVEIAIKPLDEKKCEKIIEKCGRKIQNAEMLAEGNIPEELQDLFCSDEGLFPKPKEIGFMCSCPDWAVMCKHVAATLYGVGVRLDDDPLLFFKLRGIDSDGFINTAVQNKVEAMLANENRDSPRIIRDADAMKMFGI